MLREAQYALERLGKEDGLLNQQLEELYTTRMRLSQRLHSSTDLERLFQQAREPTQRLYESCQETERKAVAIASKVRELDTAQSRLRETLDYVDRMLDLRDTVHVIKQALEQNHIDVAAQHIYRLMTPYRAHDVRHQYSDAESVELYQTLQRLQHETLQRVKDRSAAVRQSLDHRSTTLEDMAEQLFHDARLFGLLGAPKEGLEQYCSLVCDLVLHRFRKEGYIFSADDTMMRARVFEFATAIPHMLQLLSAALREHTPILERSFGDEAQNLLFDRIRSQFLHTHVLQAMRKFALDCDLEMKAQNARETVAMLRRQEEVHCDTKDLDALLEQVAYLCRLLEQFDHEMDMAIQEGAQQRESTCVRPLLEYVQVCQSHYVSLEDQFIAFSIAKAFQMETVSEKTSSVVDDVFFVVKKAIGRAFSFYNADTASAVSNVALSTLSTDYFSVLARRLLSNDAYESTNTLVNNAEQSRSYLSILHEQLIQECHRSFADAQAGKQEMVLSCIEGFQEMEQQFASLVDRGMKPKTKRVIASLQLQWQVFTRQAYTLIEEELEAESLAAFMPGLLVQLEEQVAVLKTKLLEANVQCLLQQVAEYLCLKLEKGIRTKAVTFWGALQFDRDIRLLMTFMGQHAPHPMRDVFSRVLQVALLLQVERLDEVLDLWSDDAGLWTLDAADVRALLSCRSEFSAQAIERLQLD